MRLIREVPRAVFDPTGQKTLQIYGGTVEEAVEWVVAESHRRPVKVVVERFLEEGRVGVLDDTVFVSVVVLDAVKSRVKSPGEALPSKIVDFIKRVAMVPHEPAVFEPEEDEEAQGWNAEEVDQALEAIEARTKLLVEAVALVEGLGQENARLTAEVRKLRYAT
ncbi:hypothetical protein UFOVP1382_116 [uncultured Caudovirales phage]|uniref:Uncharacterized protein n=1 Tax=uncultured Caudovirales phage TaxID=2100421 RepID=A0A6J5RXU7_9CAUD|nr:hypothetical protein UFOVP1382_116 [uncultured Caudovirales phage]